MSTLSMLELWQTEWCPASHRVRQRLTELGLTYTTRQVPVRREARTELMRATGSNEIPVLVADDAQIHGEEAILAYLDENSSHHRTLPSSVPRQPRRNRGNWRQHVPSWQQLHPEDDNGALVH
jgi:glutathione S-transferase